MKLDSSYSCCINCRYAKSTHAEGSWYCQSLGRAVSIKLNCHNFKKTIKNKYGASITKVDSISFHSKKESKRYEELKLLQKAGEIKYFLRQPSFDLGGGVKYKADFLVVREGIVTIEDVKGYETKEFKRIKKIVESLYPVEIIVLK